MNADEKFSILELLEIKTIWENLLAEFPLATEELDMSFEDFVTEIFVSLPR